jgi:lysophospholipase L1-like esterase
VNGPDTAEPRLAAYGHSWVAGEAASRPERGLTELAAALLGMSPVNRGVGGSSASETAAEVHREGAIRADAYLVLTGLNDARLHGSSPAALDAYASALETVVAAFEAAAPDAVVLLVEQPPLLDYRGYAPHDQGSTAAVEEYNRRMQHVAGGHRHVVLVRVDGWDPRTMLDDDAVHPNDRGHAALAAAAASAYRAATIGRTSPVHD